MYYLQSRYYDPAIGRFLNADNYASTGQGIIGCNMFSYCISNPVNYMDISGNMCVAIKDFGGGGSLGLSTAGFDPNGGFSSGGKKVDIPDLSSFSLVEESKKVTNGIKTGAILTGGFDAYNIDDSGFNLLSFSLTGVSLDLKNESYELSLFDLGNVSASAGIRGLPYITAMISLWSPSVTFSAFEKQVTLSVHVGARGKEFNFNPSNFRYGFANVIGFSIGIT